MESDFPVWSNIKCIFLLIIYLASPGFSWGTRDLPCRMPSLSCGKWDLVPWAGMEPKPPALGAQSLSYRTTREIPYSTEYWPVYIVNRFTYRTLQIWKLSVAKKTSCPYLLFLGEHLIFSGTISVQKTVFPYLNPVSWGCHVINFCLAGYKQKCMELLGNPWRERAIPPLLSLAQHDVMAGT